MGESCFQYFKIKQIPWEENWKADKLARTTSSMEEYALPCEAVNKILEIPTTRIDVLEVRPGAPEWALDVIIYLSARELLDKKWETRKVKNKEACFILIDGVLHRGGFSTPLLRCILFGEAQYMLAEIYKGVCGNYFGGRALVGKVMRAGYYWPHTLKDVEEFVKKCAKCQLYVPLLHYPPEELTSMLP